jgi:hypothetical protein
MITGFSVEQPRRDETAIVLCNGPSLRGVDLTALPPVATFGMNVAYRHWNRLGWFPTHYSCLDEVVGMHHANAIGDMIARAGQGAPSRYLLRRNVIKHLSVADDPHVVSFDDLADRHGALGRQPVTTGSHTLIWAITLGYRHVFLLGADANYVEIVAGAEFVGENVLQIVREEENPNYYFDDYQQAGDLYNLPNIGGDTHLKSWRVASAVAGEADAIVYNLSGASRADAFDFADVSDFLAGQPITVKPRETLRLRGRRPTSPFVRRS